MKSYKVINARKGNIEMKQFNLEDYLENDGEVVTQEGLPVEILKTDMKTEGDYCIIGLVTNQEGFQDTETWLPNGQWITDELHGSNPQDLYLKQAWYENIPEEGVLCWVWDEEETHVVALIVTEYDNKTIYPAITKNQGTYTHATPVLPSDLLGAEK